MSEKIKILLVEDELIIAESIKEILKSLGYEVQGIEVNAEEALSKIENNPPDFALLDINLKGEKDGIWLARQIADNYGFPYIFLTSHGDEKTVNEALEQHPYGYLLKPFEKVDIFTAIECALNAQERIPSPQDSSKKKFNDVIFLKDDHAYIKVNFNDLKFLKSNGNYVEVYLTDKKLLVRTSMKEILPKLPKELFMQIHRSYTVNLKFIDSFNANSVVLGDEEIPISNQNREVLMQKFMTH